MVSDAAEFEMAFAVLLKAGVDCIVIQPSLPGKPAIDMALKLRLPPFGLLRAAVGAVMSYSARTEAGFRSTATYVDKILRGAKPADLPVEEPTMFELAINLRSAKTLGLTVPPTLQSSPTR